MAGMAKQGHIHAENMALYAEDAKTTDKPWELWQTTTADHPWGNLQRNPKWNPLCLYRRKPKTKLVNGIEVPDISFIPEQEGVYYFPDIDLPDLYDKDYYDCSFFRDEMRIKGNRCYPYTEEGKRAAILHAKAMLGIN